MSESALERARAGDDQAFGDLVSPHTRELKVHCYRMLGSVVDAEDLLQETLTAAWRGLDRFEGRASIRTWLYKIATNRCLNAIRDGKRRPPVAPTPPFDPPAASRTGDVTWLQPYPDAWLADPAMGNSEPAARYESREAIELAFISALQTLPARQTSVLVLCDVVGFSVAEVATMLETKATTVKGVLQRARASIAEPGSGRDGHETASGEDRRLAQRFAQVFGDDDVDGVIALLTDAAWLAMPPAPHEYHRPAAIAAFLEASAGGRGGRLELEPTRANTQPAFTCYLVDPAQHGREPAGVLVLSVSSRGIHGITRFLDPELTRLFEAADAALS